MTKSVVVFLVAMLLGGSAIPAPAQKIVDGSGQDIPGAHVKLVLDLVTAGLTDPLSAQVRKLRPSPTKWKTPRAVYCGEINAKNRMGGYVGFSPFTVSLDDKGVTIRDQGFSEVRDLRRAVLELSGCIPKELMK